MVFSWIKERERLWLYGKAENGKGGDCFSYDNTGYDDGAVLQGAGIGRKADPCSAADFCGMRDGLECSG